MSRLSTPLPPDAGPLDSVLPVSILIADDFEPWRSHVRYLMQARPKWYIVGEACDGLETVQKAEELEPDVVILDVAMPGLNGIEAATKIRSLSAKPRIIFVSGFHDEEIRDAALRAGADAYLTKTTADNQLAKVIENAIISAR